ncbi:MAG: hypothetical protein KDD44_12565, partial [Bdellovibrionales bacterium]|nr:hypothetical protein [Bdellovibrionales bacterium]
ASGPRTSAAGGGARVERRVAKAVAESAGSEKTKASLPLEAAPAFNPSWRDFVSFVSSRSEYILAAHLRRASPEQFVAGDLTMHAAGFDADALSDKSILEKLKTCLTAYSGHADWKIRCIRSEAPAQKGDRPAAARSGEVLKGSLADEEQQSAERRAKTVDREAREHPVVKAALTTFSGSRIEKVSVLKP